MKLIHATLENGVRMLFRPNEYVWTATWVSDDGEYFSDESHNCAKVAITPGVYVLDKTGRSIDKQYISKIAVVREVNDNPAWLRTKRRRAPVWLRTQRRRTAAKHKK